MHKTKVLYIMPRLLLLALCLSILGLCSAALYSQLAIKRLERSLKYPNTSVWDTYSLGCFLIQVPNNISLVGTWFAEEDWNYVFTPKIKDPDAWLLFLSGESYKYPFSISIANEPLNHKVGMGLEEFTAGGMKGQWIEEKKSGLYSGTMNLRSPLPTFGKRLHLEIYYQNTTVSERSLMIEIVDTIRFDTTRYTDDDSLYKKLPRDEYWSNFDPDEYWEDSHKVHISEFDSAYEQMPLKETSIEQKWSWRYANMECVHTSITPRRVGVLNTYQE